MSATGNTAIDAISKTKEFKSKSMKLMCIIVSPQRFSCSKKAHPDITIYYAAKDESLNEQRHMAPGLGDKDSQNGITKLCVVTTAKGQRYLSKSRVLALFLFFKLILKVKIYLILA